MKSPTSEKIIEGNTSPFTSQKTEWNVTSRVRSTLPATPTKFAKVVQNIVLKATPKKRKALDMLNDSNPKKFKKPEVRKAMELLNRSKVNKAKGYRKGVLGVQLRGLARRSKYKRQSRIDVLGIQQFYLREDISRILPQKRFATKDGPGYVMEVPLKAAHSKYVLENPSKPVSLGKFAALRKRNVRLLSMSQREYCCCIYCVNIRFKLLTLSKSVLDPNHKKTNENDLCDIVLCGKGEHQRFNEPECIHGTCGKCHDYEKSLATYYQEIPEGKSLTWSRWVKSKNIDGYEQRIVVTKRGNKQELLKEMVAEDIKKPAVGTSFFQHLFTAKWQRMQFNRIKEELPGDSVLQVIDFAKNRQIKYQDEIKACFYTAQQITMHPVVTYFKEENRLIRYSCIVISEDNNHDFHAVNKYHQVVNEHIFKQKNATRKIVYSDGCSAQYKSRGPFSDIANDQLKVNRNYFGSEHGKNECDGEIGIINRALDRDIIAKKVIINNPEDMFYHCQKNLEINEPLSKRKFFLVRKGEIERNREHTDVKTIKDTRKLHQVVNVKENNILKARNLSCFCHNCEEGNFLTCLNKKYVQPFENKKLCPSKLKNNVKTAKVVSDSTVSPTPDVQPVAVEASDVPPITVEAPDGQPITVEAPDVSTVSPIVSTRCKYFLSVLTEMQRLETFESLQMKCFALNDEVNQLYPVNANPKINICDQKLTGDKVAIRLMPDNLEEEFQRRLPVNVIGDGNCLARCGSVLAFGTETEHVEMRVRVIIELCTNETYIDNLYVNRGIDLPETESSKLISSYTMFSDCYIAGDKITTALTKRVYQKEIMKIVENNSYMGIWQIFALSSVLKCKIRSIYPSLGDRVPRLLLNRYILPRDDCHLLDHVCAVMWTTTRDDLNPQNWIPNHFVPVVSVNSDDIEFVDEFVDDLDNGMELTTQEFDSIVEILVRSDLNFSETLVVNTTSIDTSEKDDKTVREAEDSVHVTAQQSNASVTKATEEQDVIPGNEWRRDDTTETGSEAAKRDENGNFSPGEHSREVNNEKQEEYKSGDHIAICCGAQVLPAVVESWPFVYFFSKTKKKNTWMLSEVKHSVFNPTIKMRLEPPDISLVGERVYYKFIDELIQYTAITWLSEFIMQAGRPMLQYASGIINAILPNLGNDFPNKRTVHEATKKLNTALMDLVCEDDDLPTPKLGSPDMEQSIKEMSIEDGVKQSLKNSEIQLDVLSVIEVLCHMLEHESFQTKIASLQWLCHLLLKVPNKTFRHVEKFFPVLLLTLSDQSEEVVLLDLEALAEISSNPAGHWSVNTEEVVKTSDKPNLVEGSHLKHGLNKYFTKFMISLVDLFKKNGQLLEERGSFIIRQLAQLLNAEDVFQILSQILVDDDDMLFSCTMVQTINTILLTSTELFELRNQLKELKTQESCSLFTCLYKSWCHSPIATVSLCYLTQNYHHACQLMQTFGDLEVTVDFLKEIDKLVQLIESPIFAYLRLQLLDVENSQDLIKSLYGLLMLLPQSEAFKLLRYRLDCIPHYQLATIYDKRKTNSPPDKRTHVAKINFQELLEHFLQVQTKHREIRRKTAFKSTKSHQPP